jgi:hypothetical protein
MAYNDLIIISQKVHDYLYENIEKNLDRYIDGDFSDLYNENGWNINISSFKVNMEHLKYLDSSSDSAHLDIKNSRLVWQALHSLTPAMACDSRIWTRISHVEALSFSRQRWIKNKDSKENIIRDIRKHFFARTLTQYRDDHSIARLWWSIWFARKVNRPDTDSVLNILFSKADTRQSIIERSGISTREYLIRAIFDYIHKFPNINSKQIKDFMKSINFHGSGIVFEALDDSEVERFLDSCMLMEK